MVGIVGITQLNPGENPFSCLGLSGSKKGRDNNPIFQGD